MKQQPSPASDLDPLQDRGYGVAIADETHTHNGNGTRRHTHVTARRFSAGSILFLEGGTAACVFLLNRGRVKLSVGTSDGRSLTLGIAAAGDTVGLNAVIAGTPHEATAEALEFCHADLVPRAEFLAHLRNDANTAVQAIRQLSAGNLHLCQLITSLAGSETVFVKLARLFLSWTPAGNGHGPIHLKNTFTHQQIGEMLGTSRETVTRALGVMRQQGLLTLSNGDLFINDRRRLQLVSENGRSNGNGRVTPRTYGPNGLR
jgi:CRP/FNR family cyclic AMP-dependent transcriptional regulator